MCSLSTILFFSHCADIDCIFAFLKLKHYQQAIFDCSQAIEFRFDAISKAYHLGEEHFSEFHPLIQQALQKSCTKQARKFLQLILNGS